MYYVFDHEPLPSELQHHGILGQRWGIRNGPPYPLKDRFSGAKEVLESLGVNDYNDFRPPKNVYDYVTKKDGEKTIAFGLAESKGENVVDLSIAVSPSHRGQHIAEELSIEMITKALDDPNIETIQWAVEKNNVGSRKLAEKLGFKYERDIGNYNLFSMMAK